jgi:polyketide biosynthesis enoyl-CoA hydratase PksI
MVRLTLDNGIAHLTLSDPARSNALGEPMVHAIADAFAAIDADHDVRVVVLSADGETFSCGAPRELLLRLSRREVRPTDILLPRLLLSCPVPVIAAMAGPATGGGFALALAADIAILARESRYGFTFMDLGFTPGMGSTALGEHVLPPAVLHEMLYTGELRRGADLERSGFNHVLPRAQVHEKALDLATRIAAKPRVAIEALKRTLSLTRRQAFELSITTESLMHEVTFSAPGLARAIEESYVE